MLKYHMKKLLELLSLNINFTDNVSYRRVLLITSISLVTAIALAIFAVINFFLLQNPLVASLDLIASIISLSAILSLKKTHNITLAAKIATFNLMFFFFSFIYINGNSHFSLIWTIFLPIFAILANGKRKGLYFSLIFYIPLLSLAFYNIGVWNNGEWLLIDWIRLSASASILTFAIYMNEQALEASDKKLSQIRLKEKEYIKMLHEKSITDELTGLYNRRYFYDMVEKLTALAKRKEHYITFFILDIDYFKNYNDYYGHINGDQTLIKIANAIKGHIQRGDDFVFRLGGEEFAGIIISEDKNRTHDWIKELCPVIEALEIEHIESHTSNVVTVSIGIATVSCDDDHDMNKLYSFADQALYTAKNCGKNRTELSFKCS